MGGAPLGQQWLDWGARPRPAPADYRRPTAAARLPPDCCVPRHHPTDVSLFTVCRHGAQLRQQVPAVLLHHPRSAPGELALALLSCFSVSLLCCCPCSCVAAAPICSCCAASVLLLSVRCCCCSQHVCLPPPRSPTCAASLTLCARPHARRAPQVNTASSGGVESVANVTDIHGERGKAAGGALDWAPRTSRPCARERPGAPSLCPTHSTHSTLSSLPLTDRRRDSRFWGCAAASQSEARGDACVCRASSVLRLPRAPPAATAQPHPSLTLPPASARRRPPPAAGHLEHRVEQRQPRDCGGHERPGPAGVRHDAGEGRCACCACCA